MRREGGGGVAVACLKKLQYLRAGLKGGTSEVARTSKEALQIAPSLLPVHLE